MKWWSNLNVKLQYINAHWYSVTRQSVRLLSPSPFVSNTSEKLQFSRWWASTGCLSWCCVSDISNMTSVLGQITPIYSITVTHNFSCALRLSRAGDIRAVSRRSLWKPRVTGAVRQKDEAETCCWHHNCNTEISKNSLIYFQKETLNQDVGINTIKKKKEKILLILDWRWRALRCRRHKAELHGFLEPLSRNRCCRYIPGFAQNQITWIWKKSRFCWRFCLVFKV